MSTPKSDRRSGTPNNKNNPRQQKQQQAAESGRNVSDGRRNGG